MAVTDSLEIAHFLSQSELCQSVLYITTFSTLYTYTLMSSLIICAGFSPRIVDSIHHRLNSRSARIVLCVAMSIATELPHYAACVQFLMMLSAGLATHFNYLPRNHYTVISSLGILVCCYSYLQNLRIAQVLKRHAGFSKVPKSCDARALLRRSLNPIYQVVDSGDLRIIKDISFYASKDFNGINDGNKRTRYEGLLDVYISGAPNDDLKPVVIYAHGGGWTSSSKEQPSPLIRVLVERGFLVVSLNYRLAPEYPQPAGYEDICSALTWTRYNIKTFGGDPNFIVLSGDSAGAHLVLLTAITVEPCENVQGIILLSPSLIVRNEFGDDEPRKMFFQDHVCAGDVEAARKLGLVQYLSSVRALPPVLAFHGESDNLVSHESAMKFDLKMRQNGLRMTLVSLKHTHHAFMIFNSPKNIVVSGLAAQWASQLFYEWKTQFSS